MEIQQNDYLIYTYLNVVDAIFAIVLEKRFVWSKFFLFEIVIRIYFPYNLRKSNAS